MAASSKRKGVQEGFTLIELLVSLSIIGIITGQMLANFRVGQQGSELRFSAEILTNQLREMQTNALSGRLIDICTGGADNLEVCEPAKQPAVQCTGGSCDQRIPSGYGIRLSTASPVEYTIFYDTDGDYLYDEGEELINRPYVSTGTVEFIAANVSTPVDIVFKPPFGQVFVNGLTTGASPVELTLRHNPGGQERHVTVSRITGKIEHD